MDGLAILRSLYRHRDSLVIYGMDPYNRRVAIV